MSPKRKQQQLQQRANPRRRVKRGESPAQQVPANRAGWIELLDGTGATAVQSNDLLGIVADYLLGT